MTYGNQCQLDSVPFAKAYDGQCLVTPTSSGSAMLLAGTWSGTGIRMVVNATGATISVGCTQGTIDEPLIIGERIWFLAGRRDGLWQGTLGRAAVTYSATMYADGLYLLVANDAQMYLLHYEDLGAPPCP